MEMGEKNTSCPANRLDAFATGGKWHIQDTYNESISPRAGLKAQVRLGNSIASAKMRLKRG